MNERIQKLREHSVSQKPSISPERAILVTEFYKSDAAEKVSVPVKRALAFKHILRNKRIHIGEGELIVGERGPSPKATPTYPEICTHTMKDLEILNGRDRIPYTVNDETRQIYETTIIPYWKGKSLRDRIFEEMTEEWKACYETGMFTEFMEQRAPGHTALGDKIYRKGFLDLKADIRESMAQLDYYNDPEAYDKQEPRHHGCGSA